jgi:hypothetical protein
LAKPSCHAIFSFFILLNHLLIKKKEKERERERERGQDERKDNQRAAVVSDFLIF